MSKKEYEKLSDTQKKLYDAWFKIARENMNNISIGEASDTLGVILAEHAFLEWIHDNRQDSPFIENAVEVAQSTLQDRKEWFEQKLREHADGSA